MATGQITVNISVCRVWLAALLLACALRLPRVAYWLADHPQVKVR